MFDFCSGDFGIVFALMFAINIRMLIIIVIEMADHFKGEV